MKHNKNRSQYVLPRLGHYLYHYKWMLILCLILAVVSNLLALAGPYLSGRAIDALSDGVGKVKFPQVYTNVILMIVLFVASSVLTYLLTILMLRISQNTVRRMRKDVFEKLQRLPVQYFDHNSSGDLISRISYDMDVIQTSLSTDMVQVCASVVTVVGSFVMMVLISKPLVLMMIVTIPLSIFYTKYITRQTRPLFRRRSAKLGELDGYVEEMVSGQKSINAYARERVMQERFEQTNGPVLDAYYEAEYYGTKIGPSVNFINNLSQTLVATFGAILYLYQSITLGHISSFLLYSRKFSGPINEVANIMSELQSALAAAERIFRVMDSEEEPADSTTAVEQKKTEGNVSFEGVRFGYDADQMIVKNLSLSVKPGEVIAIVGPTGAGKTTIINLLMRFYDYQEGTIKMDGIPITEITRKSLRANFAMVLQDTWLFEGTVYENIAYGCDNATKEDVVRVAKAAHIHKFIMRLPQEYDTILREDGVNLSRGQKQLLTIARAMLLKANVLILDEATSNVDIRTEKRIQRAMLNLMENKTCFVIAHRLSTIQNANQILVINKGNVVEQGTHKELLAKKGFYQKLYESQFVTQEG